MTLLGPLPARIGAAAARIGRTMLADPMLMAELAFWRMSLPVLKHVVSVRTLARTMWCESGNGNATAAAHVRDVVTASGRLFVSTNCLERSLVLYRLLSRAGAGPRLVMGAEHRGQAVAGHVWVEIDGVPLGEPDAVRYFPIVAFDAGGREHALGTPAA